MSGKKRPRDPLLARPIYRLPEMKVASKVTAAWGSGREALRRHGPGPLAGLLQQATDATRMLQTVTVGRWGCPDLGPYFGKSDVLWRKYFFMWRKWPLSATLKNTFVAIVHFL